MRLAKGLGLFWGQDIKMGEEHFDSIFRVQGHDEAAIARYFDDASMALLVSFARGGRSIYGRTGSLQITSSGLVYVEGPYRSKTIGKVVEKSVALIEEILRIADEIESVP